MKKLSIIATLCVVLLGQNAFAKKIDLDNIVEKSTLNKTATVAISVKNARTGLSEYEYNQNKLLHPASVLKVLTFTAALDTLGIDYKYETKIGIDVNNNVYIKLAGDPSLTISQLKEGISKLPKKDINNIYIDDKNLDRYEWGIGWMWDDETNPRMAKISPYNLNHNTLNVQITPTTPNQQAKITPLEQGAATIINMVTTGDKDEISIYRQNSISPNIVYLYGTIATSKNIKIPIGNPERFFLTNLSLLLKGRNISHSPIMLGAYQKNIQTIYTISNDISPLFVEILQNSNNFYSETLFKTAGAVKEKGQGTFVNSYKMFESYYKKLGLNLEEIVLADGSGVSRNNLFSADWISEALFRIQQDKNFNIIKENLAQPEIGTLSKRLPELKNNFYGKTGTLANISTIAGYLTDQKGEEHIVTILISNFAGSNEKAIELQDKIINEIYNE